MACLLSPPFSATGPISVAGICWPHTAPHVPFQQQPDSVYLEKNRKLGSARNQSTPFLSPGLRDAVAAGGSAGRTQGGCGVGALPAKPRGPALLR